MVKKYTPFRASLYESAYPTTTNGHQWMHILCDVDCKENGLWPIWLKWFWCLMIDITYGLIDLQVFGFCSSHDEKRIGLNIEGARHQKKTFKTYWRNTSVKQSPRHATKGAKKKKNNTDERCGAQGQTVQMHRTDYVEIVFLAPLRRRSNAHKVNPVCQMSSSIASTRGWYEQSNAPGCQKRQWLFATATRHGRSSVP
jgi:hypothetical protein